MRKWEKISLSIALVIIAGIISLGIWQSDNIRAVWLVFTKSEAEIAAEMDMNKKNLEKELKEKYPSVISDFTAEEERKIMTGEMTYEEVVETLNSAYENNKNETEKNKADSGKKAADANVSADSVIGETVVKLYSLKAFYLGQLGQLEATVKSEYAALPKEKRNLVGKQNIASKYMGVALGYMESCDAEVAALLTGLETKLLAIGADTSIIQTIQSAYESEKTMKKAYYLKLLD